MTKHIIKEGARFHVLYWSEQGTHCSEKDCEVNKQEVKDDGKWVL